MVAATLVAAAATIVTAPSRPDLGHDFTTFSSTPRPRARASAKTLTQGAVPLRLVIVRLGVDATVIPVHADSAGRLAIPADVHTLGWDSNTATPGSATGSVLIVGHLDAPDGQLGTLAALFQAQPGDQITVERRGATALRYRITQRRTLPKRALPEDAYTTSGDAHLTLVTCAPPYKHGTGYLDNLVITALPSPA